MIIPLFSRFLFVGVINTVVGLSIMYFLYYIGCSYWVATFIGNLIGACLSYVLNKNFTFASQQPVQSTIYRFFTVIMFCYFLAYFISRPFITKWFLLLASIPLHYAEYTSILLGTILYTIFNFIGQKKFVFQK